MQQLWQPEPLLCRFAWPCSLICSSSPSALPFCPPLPAPPADGRYCTVDPAYQSLLLELVLLTAVEQGWPLSWLPGGQVAEALQAHGYDPRVTLHCLNTFGTPAGSGGGSGSAPASAAQQEGDSMDAEAGGAGEPASASAGGTAGAACDGAYALEETAVCLHFARKLLQGQPDWELARFQEAWQGAVPEVRRRMARRSSSLGCSCGGWLLRGCWRVACWLASAAAWLLCWFRYSSAAFEESTPR